MVWLVARPLGIKIVIRWTPFSALRSLPAEAFLQILRGLDHRTGTSNATNVFML